MNSERVVGATAFPPKAETTVAYTTDSTQQSKPTITIYVRRDESSNPKVKARTIFLRPIPDTVSMDDLLAMGFAYDGDTVTRSVDQYTEAFDGDGAPQIESFADEVLARNMYHEPWTLAQALNSVQRVLVKWLRDLGYEVKIA